MTDAPAPALTTDDWVDLGEQRHAAASLDASTQQLLTNALSTRVDAPDETSHLDSASSSSSSSSSEPDKHPQPDESPTSRHASSSSDDGNGAAALAAFRQRWIKDEYAAAVLGRATCIIVFRGVTSGQLVAVRLENQALDTVGGLAASDRTARYRVEAGLPQVHALWERCVELCALLGS